MNGRQTITIFLAANVDFDRTAERELFSGFRLVGTLADLPAEQRDNPVAIALKAEARGARAVVVMAGARSPFGIQVKEWAESKGMITAFIYPVSAANDAAFARGFRNAQRELETVLANTGEETT